MQLTEALDFMAGQDRRCRHIYEATRILRSTIIGVLTGEESDWELPWDNTMTDKEKAAKREADKAAEARLAKMAKAWEKKLNINNDNGKTDKTARP